MGMKQDSAGSPGSATDETVRLLQEKVDLLTVNLSRVMSDNGLECAIRDGVEKLEKVFAPLQALATVHAYDGNEAEAIDMLRASLARPDFQKLELDVGRTPFVGQQSEMAE